MNKQALIRAIAQNTGLTISATTKAVDAFIDEATNALMNGEAITLKGFGTLTPTRRAAREARGFAKASPEKTFIAFKASSCLVDKLNSADSPSEAREHSVSEA